MKTQGQILPPAAQHRVDRGIVPDVGAVAAMLAEFNHVEVRRRSDPVDKDQLMLGPIKRSHPEAAHGSVPTLDVSVGDAIQPVGKDVAGDCCQPVVGVRESEYTCIKGKCVGQQEAVQERSTLKWLMRSSEFQPMISTRLIFTASTKDHAGHGRKGNRAALGNR